MLLVDAIANATEIKGNIILSLAIFHTFFNVVGVILMWPIEPKLSKFLLTLYKSPLPQQRESSLDANISTIPDLAIPVMISELNYLSETIGRVDFPTLEKPMEKEKFSLLKNQIDDVIEFISLTSKSNLTKKQSDQLTAGLAASHYLQNAYKTLNTVIEEHYSLAQTPVIIHQQLNAWLVAVNEFNQLVHHGDKQLQQKYMSELMARYQQVKKRLLEAAVAEQIDIQAVDAALQIASLSRRFFEQIIQAEEALHSLATETCSDVTSKSAIEKINNDDCDEIENTDLEK